MTFCACGNKISHNRALLNYSTCLLCGEREAQAIKAYRAKCIAPAYNKGAYQYVATREHAKDVGR